MNSRNGNLACCDSVQKEITPLQERLEELNYVISNLDDSIGVLRNRLQYSGLLLSKDYCEEKKEVDNCKRPQVSPLEETILSLIDRIRSINDNASCLISEYRG